MGVSDSEEPVLSKEIDEDSASVEAGFAGDFPPPQAPNRASEARSKSVFFMAVFLSWPHHSGFENDDEILIINM